MKSILVPLRAYDGAESALDNAITVARGFDAYVEGLVVEPVFQLAVGEAMAAVPAYDTQMLDDWRAKAETVRAKFDETMAQAGIASGWHQGKGSESAVVGEYGRLFDLIVIGRSQGDDGGEVTETCEAALFDSGRPVLLAPREAPSALGKTAVISWNGSTETARTIALGLPFIDRAEAVFVLTVEGATVPGPSGDQVAAYLGRRGIEAKAITAKPGDRSQGEAILEEADALGADLLLKGAYTHSRLRQMVFGGPTKHILSHAELPVLMAH
jgi:nucleotide-binding universal stress UspA family protein